MAEDEIEIVVARPDQQTLLVIGPKRSVSRPTCGISRWAPGYRTRLFAELARGGQRSEVEADRPGTHDHVDDVNGYGRWGREVVDLEDDVVGPACGQVDEDVEAGTAEAVVGAQFGPRARIREPARITLPSSVVSPSRVQVPSPTRTCRSGPDLGGQTTSRNRRSASRMTSLVVRCPARQALRSRW